MLYCEYTETNSLMATLQAPATIPTIPVRIMVLGSCRTAPTPIIREAVDSKLSARAVATSSIQSSPETLGADDEVAEKLGFEKGSDEFIEECKSRAVLYKHKKTGTEIMSVTNDDENKVFGIIFRTPL